MILEDSLMVDEKKVRKPRRTNWYIGFYRKEELTVEDIFKAYGIKEGETPEVGDLPLKTKTDGKKIDKNEEDYDPRCLRKEFVDMDRDTFLVDQSKMNLCFLGVLAKICSMLTALDFVNLSLACRYLHWLVFGFCTCYTPYTVEVDIEDQLLKTLYGTHGSLPKMVYFLNKDNSGRDGSRNERSREYLSKVDGYHGIFVYQPTCLKRAFHFEKMELMTTVELIS